MVGKGNIREETHGLHHHSTPFLQVKCPFPKPPTCHPEALPANLDPSMRNARCPWKRRRWGTFLEGWRVLTWLQSRGWQEAVEHWVAPSLQTHLEHRPRLQPSPSWNTRPSKEQGSKGQENKGEVSFPTPFNPLLPPEIKSTAFVHLRIQNCSWSKQVKESNNSASFQGACELRALDALLPLGFYKKRHPNSWSILGTCSPSA